MTVPARLSRKTAVTQELRFPDARVFVDPDLVRPGSSTSYLSHQTNDSGLLTITG